MSPIPQPPPPDARGPLPDRGGSSRPTDDTVQGGSGAVGFFLSLAALAWVIVFWPVPRERKGLDVMLDFLTGWILLVAMLGGGFIAAIGLVFSLRRKGPRSWLTIAGIGINTLIVGGAVVCLLAFLWSDL